MLFDNFSEVLAFVLNQGYFIFFALMVIEGPIVNTAASFAASLGHFNIFIIIFLAILGDLAGDLIYFYIGRVRNLKIMKKYERKMGFSKDKINFIEKNMKKHFLKIMLIIKLTPGFATIGLMFVGAAGIKLNKFIINSLLISIPACLFFSLWGYFGGIGLDLLFKYLKIGQYIFVGFLVIMGVAVYLYKKIVFIIINNSNRQSKL